MYSTWMMEIRFAGSCGESGSSSVFRYEPTTSADGWRRLASGKIQFAGVATLPTTLMPNAWVLPMLAEAIVVIYNLPGVGHRALTIPRQELANVFLGRIRQWSQLAQWNPALVDMHQNIAVVVRSDSSSTTDGFTSALSSFSSEWKTKVGKSTRPSWPTAGVRCDGDAGVAVCVTANPYSIGYASQSGIKAFASGIGISNITNLANNSVGATLDSVQAAMDAVALALSDGFDRSGGKTKQRTLFVQSLVDPPENALDAYPISTFAYLMFDAGRPSCPKLTQILFLIYWAWTNEDSQNIVAAQGSVPVSKNILRAVLPQLLRVECREAGVMDVPLRQILITSKSCDRGAPEHRASSGFVWLALSKLLSFRGCDQSAPQVPFTIFPIR